MVQQESDPVTVALARVYALILSWPEPGTGKTVEGEQGSEAQSPTTADSADPKKDLSR